MSIKKFVPSVNWIKCLFGLEDKARFYYNGEVRNLETEWRSSFNFHLVRSFGWTVGNAVTVDRSKPPPFKFGRKVI